MRSFYQKITTVYMNNNPIWSDESSRIYVYMEIDPEKTETIPVSQDDLFAVAKMAGLKTNKKRNIVNGQLVTECHGVVSYRRTIPDMTFGDLLMKSPIPVALDFLRDQLVAPFFSAYFGEKVEPAVYAKHDYGEVNQRPVADANPEPEEEQK